MARRPTASANPPDIPLTLQKAFNACRSTEQGNGIGPSVHIEKAAEVAVGERLRDLRQQRELSIRALAARSGLAINTLSMIENGKTSPSVSTLQILARVLGVPIAAFFEQENVEKKVVHGREGQRPMITVDTTRLEHLGKDLAGSAVQPFVVTLEPGSGSGQNLIVHTGHEFVYCLSGQVQYCINEETYLLGPGDSLVFESHLPHRWGNIGTDSAQIILVLIPADIRDTPAERHFPLE
jgi:transcriptional regulator with XRE-family HTH domain